MIIRLRPAYTPDELSGVYGSGVYDHTRWPDHIQRVEFTVEFVRGIAAEFGCRSIADLSCGDGAVVFRSGLEEWHMGDMVPGPHCGYHGPIEETIHRIPDVDLFVLSETLEHVDDPVSLLRDIRSKARTLVLSTPYGETDDGNPEHYWGWDLDGIEELLESAGWWPDRSVLFTPDTEQVYYTYQIWAATRDTP